MLKRPVWLNAVGLFPTDMGRLQFNALSNIGNAFNRTNY